MKMLIRYTFLFDLDSIQKKLSSDYSLSIRFSCHFAFSNGQSFCQYKPLQIVRFCRVGSIPFFNELCSSIDKNTGEKFEDVFLVKIANK